MPFFRANNPFNTVLLFFYALILKLYWILHPKPPIISAGDGWMSEVLLKKITGLLSDSPITYSAIDYLLLVGQALMINRVVNQQRFMNKANYTPAMSYILITSLFFELNTLSIILIVNTLIIWAWGKMNRLYNTDQPKTILYNIGLLLGVSTILYFPSCLFGFLLIAAIAINRPFRPREWLVTLLGVVTPYYFVLGYLYLTNKTSLLYLAYLHFGVFKYNFSYVQWAVIVIILFTMLAGFSYAQRNLNKQLVQVRKSWYIVTIYLLVSFFLALLLGRQLQYYLFPVVPITVYIATFFYYPKRRWLPIALHWVLVGFIMYFSYYNSFNNH